MNKMNSLLLTKEWSNLQPNSEKMISAQIISKETILNPFKIPHFPIKSVWSMTKAETQIFKSGIFRFFEFKKSNNKI